MTVKFYRVTLGLSLVVNAFLLTVMWLYVHFAATLAVVDEAVSFFN